jgi:hypothetical protein
MDVFVYCIASCQHYSLKKLSPFLNLKFETIPGMGGRMGIKENDGGGEFSYDILKELL